MGTKLSRKPGEYTGCYGCGPDNPIGLKLQFEREAETIVSHVELASHFSGYRELVHGGVVASLLDEAMGWAMLHIAGRYGVTRGLNIHYRRPVRVDRSLLLRSRVVEDRDTELTLEATLEDDRGRLLARGEGSWVVVRAERATASR